MLLPSPAYSLGQCLVPDETALKPSTVSVVIFCRACMAGYRTRRHERQVVVLAQGLLNAARRPAAKPRDGTEERASSRAGSSTPPRAPTGGCAPFNRLTYVNAAVSAKAGRMCISTVGGWEPDVYRVLGDVGRSVGVRAREVCGKVRGVLAQKARCRDGDVKRRIPDGGLPSRHCRERCPVLVTSAYSPLRDSTDHILHTLQQPKTSRLRINVSQVIYAQTLLMPTF